ncbi:MAG: cobalt-precorrin 5A hydrolase [Methanothrix sp.]|nr:cobalt-precorrin 5A hydrolase [Methanothrix sp.]MDD3709988.1 cobalt-precorrin 5A hydrolase [Methanothrix sp.]MDD5768538.1 cobalt-precorrin 5A hydrolase [Methanothrix sp.]MDI9398014.1 cobalt-precorrin 5A hydrolase [Euryarchaeota archaeon]
MCTSLSDRYEPEVVVYKKGDPEETLESLREFDLVVAVMAVGIVMRLICPALRNKWTDRPVVAIDASLRSAVPIVGGHHGANDLALHLHQNLGVYPAITTATEAADRPSLEGAAESLGARLANRDSSKEVNLAFLREDVPIIRLSGPKVVLVDEDVAVLKRSGGVVVGLGARRGVDSSEVLEAVASALKSAGMGVEDIRVIATAWIKRDEIGIKRAAEEMGCPVVYLEEEVLNAQSPTTESRASSLGLVGVAEPAVLALSERLIMPKRVYGRVTVALGE